MAKNDLKTGLANIVQAGAEKWNGLSDGQRTVAKYGAAVTGGVLVAGFWWTALGVAGYELAKRGVKEYKRRK